MSKGWPATNMPEARAFGNSSRALLRCFRSAGLRQAGLPASYFCIKAFSETDLTEDRKAFDVPTLVLHGDDDQIVPIGPSALLSSKQIKNAALKVYEGAPRYVHDPQRPGQRGPSCFIQS
jgi:non-heme chloroperoxidase